MSTGVITSSAPALRYSDTRSALGFRCNRMALVWGMLLLAGVASSQEAWPAIPGIDEGAASVHSQETFLPALGFAAVSYGLARWVDRAERAHRVQSRLGAYGLEDHLVLNQAVGVEQQVSPWFSLSWEVFVQEWRADLATGNTHGMGVGLNPWAKWTAFAARKISPFVEVGTGGFYGFKRFPEEGTRFTFHLNTNLGLEWALDASDCFRLTYGHLHQSNNGLGERNPGIVGNGLTVTWSRRFAAERP